jgi:uncharacterized membrane protein
MDKKGQVGGIVALVIGLVVAVILLIGVLIPIMTAVVGTNSTTGQNFTGVNATIAFNLTTFVMLGVLVLIAGIAVYGFANKG